MSIWRDRFSPLGLVGVITFTGFSLWQFGFPGETIAQPIPDETLGAERSRVLDAGESVFGIIGGARRGSNLFHSFQELNVENNGAVYFINPAGIENILSRVTGDNPSNINGILGVFGGEANLFLMNPNGIVFGPNAQLVVQGSFVATTADAIGFGNQGVFSAIDPQVPSPLLAVNPSAFFFNQVAAQPDRIIENQAVLAVPNGENLLLLGGDVTVNGGRLNAFGGRVNIGSVRGTGTIGLTPDSSFTFPAAVQRGAVAFTNAARADVRTSDSGGNLTITAGTIALTRESELLAGISTGVNTPSRQAGNIVLDASEQVLITQASTIFNQVLEGTTGNAGNIEIIAPILEVLGGAQLTASTRGRGNAGSVIITATDRVTFRGRSADGQFSSAAFSSIEVGGNGVGGNVQITAPILDVLDGASLTASTLGQGNAGSVIITATDRVTFRGTSANGEFSSAALSRVETGVIGNAGNIEITTPILEVLDGASLTASTRGRGNAGSVIITATDRVTFRGTSANGEFSSAALSRVETGVIGNAGNIEITTPILEVLDGASLTVSTLGQGNAGDVIITATDRVTFSSGNAFSRIDENGNGTAGNIEITAPILEVLNGAQLRTSNEGQGDAGSVIISASLVEVLGGASLTASTFGQGDAGDVIITATDRVTFRGRSADGQLTSAAFSSIEAGGNGLGGSIEITAPILEVLDGAQLSAISRGRGNAGSVIITASLVEVLDGGQLTASTRGQGDAGDVIITATDRVTFSNGNAFSRIDENGNGTAGNIEITAPILQVLNGAQLRASNEGQGDAGSVIISASSVEVLDGASLTASTFGRGNAGSVIITATDRVTFRGRSADGQLTSAAFSSIETGGNGVGGNIEITAPILEVLDGAQLSAISRGQGNAGSVIITASERVLLDGVGSTGFSSGLFINTFANATGRGGLVAVTTPDLLISNGAVISARTDNDQPGGRVRIAADQLIVRGGGQVLTTALGSGQAGNITINADRIRISGSDPTFTQRLEEFGGRTANEGNGESGLFASTRSNSMGNGGTIRLRADSLFLGGTAQISALTAGTGNAGNINLRGIDRLSLDNSTITTTINSEAVLANPAPGFGDINIQARDISLTNDANITASTAGQGNAGDIMIRRAETISLTDSSSIATEVQPNAQGEGGSISITTRQLNISGNQSEVTASTLGQGSAGLLDVTANQIRLNNGGRLITATATDRPAGSITLNVAGSLTLDGRGSGIFANTFSNSTGGGGSITLNTADLQLTDRARISAQGQGTGAAGDIRIGASGDVTLGDRATISTQSQGEEALAGDIQLRVGNTFSATDSDITTSAANASGGNIRLSARDIRLFEDSDILTNSAIDGGNVTLAADSILALGDSDIIAAAGERGGNITLDTSAFFGEDFQADAADTSSSTLDGNDRVDINASGQISSGTISVPDTSFVQDSLVDLPETAIDTESLIAASCVVRSQEQNGRFVIIGRGGLAERPGEVRRSIYATGEVRSIPDASEQPWQMGDPILEPQGMYELEDGRMILSQECD